MQLVVVLGKTAIADFAVSEDLLDIPEGLLHFDTHTGFDFLGFQLVSIQPLPTARPFGNEPRDVLAVLLLIPLLNAKITRIAEDSLLFTMQQFSEGTMS